MKYVRQRKANTTGSHLYGESKNNKTKARVIDTERSLVAVRGGSWGGGQVKSMKGVKGYRCPVIKKKKKSRDLMCNVVTTVNNTVLYI